MRNDKKGSFNFHFFNLDYNREFRDLELYQKCTSLIWTFCRLPEEKGCKNVKHIGIEVMYTKKREMANFFKFFTDGFPDDYFSC